jgi:alpha-glucosidase
MAPAPHPLDPHHDGSVQYVDHAGAGLGDEVTLRVRVPHGEDGSPGARRVVLRAVRDGEPAVSNARQVFEDTAGASWEARLRLVNRVTSYRFLVSRGPDDFRWLTATGVHERDVSDGGDFRISTDQRLPDWVLDQVGYQVFPDRFGKTEVHAPVPDWAIPCEWDQPVVHKGPDVPFQLYGGTLDGVAEHLDQLDVLGATLLYLTPVFEAWSTHRYDAVSFDRVDPLLGGDDALERLTTAVHEHGLRLMGDLTTNHTGEHHDWFVRAQGDPDSPERAFYRFGDDHPHGFAAWLDIASLPKLDHASAELARRLYAGPDSVVAHWLRNGLDGWRVDVANMTGRLGADDRAHEVAAAMRRTMDEVSPDAWLLAEHGHDASADLTGPGWHGTMDYAGFTRPVWCWLNGGAPGGPGLPHGLDYLGLPVDIPVLPATAAVDTMREVHGSMPWASWAGSTMHLDSHDTPRFRTVTGGGTDGGTDLAGHGRDRHLVGLGLQMTMPGVPVVFMGDELGLTAVDGEHARTPYPWDRPDTWDGPTFEAYQQWIALRRHHVALRRGGLRWLHADDDSMTFVREHPDEILLVHAVRQAAAPASIPAHALGPAVGLIRLVGSAADVSGSTVVLPGDQGVSVHAVTSSS